MKKIKYLFARIKNMNFKQMREKINYVHTKSGKGKLSIFFDMISCGLKYQAGYMDYWLFEMYNLTNDQRKTVMTRGKNNELIKRFNNPEFIYLFDNKGEFNQKFKDYIKREWIILNENNLTDFLNFVKNKEYIICKPLTGSCGKGIEKIKSSDYKNKKDLYNYLIKKELLLCEELIKQHETMNKLNSSCINTIRVITIYNNGKGNIVAAYLRIGNGNFVDNFNSGGMVVPVDEQTGIINYPALDKKNNLFHVHPISKTKIVGFKIPYWEEVRQYVISLSSVIKEVGVVGWDIAITPTGPDIVEGNNYPGHDIYQLPPHRTNGIGILPKFEKYL